MIEKIFYRVKYKRFNNYIRYFKTHFEISKEARISIDPNGKIEIAYLYKKEIDKITFECRFCHEEFALKSKKYADERYWIDEDDFESFKVLINHVRAEHIKKHKLVPEWLVNLCEKRFAHGSIRRMGLPFWRNLENSNFITAGNYHGNCFICKKFENKISYCYPHIEFIADPKSMICHLYCNSKGGETNK